MVGVSLDDFNIGTAYGSTQNLSSPKCICSTSESHGLLCSSELVIVPDVLRTSRLDSQGTRAVKIQHFLAVFSLH